MKKHFTGATYDLTQDNMNYLIQQLEDWRDMALKLAEAVTRLNNAWASQDQSDAKPARIALLKAVEALKDRKT